MENFKDKIISKVLADRLAQILPTLISKEQRSFVHNMNIKGCIFLTLKVVNTLHNKSTHGNLKIKSDIAKTFDTLDWNFLILVLRKFSICKNSATRFKQN